MIAKHLLSNESNNSEKSIRDIGTRKNPEGNVNRHQALEKVKTTFYRNRHR